MEVETPILTKSTPEGARDFIVPSRMNPGKFYALPQSPQLFKQLLMVARHRALLPDRALLPRRGPARRPPARVHAGRHRDVASSGRTTSSRMMEDVMREVMHEAGHDLPTPLPRITWHEAMERYGSDRPDTRFGLELVDVERGLLGKRVQGVRGRARERRRDQGASTRRARATGAAAASTRSTSSRSTPAPRAWRGSRSRRDGEVKRPVAKFFTEAEMAALRDALARRARRPRLHGRRRARRRQRGARRAAPASSPTSSGIERTGLRTRCGSSTSRCSSGTRRRSAGTRTTTRSRCPFAEHVDTARVRSRARRSATATTS